MAGLWAAHPSIKLAITELTALVRGGAGDSDAPSGSAATVFAPTIVAAMLDLRTQRPWTPRSTNSRPVTTAYPLTPPARIRTKTKIMPFGNIEATVNPISDGEKSERWELTFNRKSFYQRSDRRRSPTRDYPSRCTVLTGFHLVFCSYVNGVK